MEFGVVFASKVGDYPFVQLAEELGYDQAWFFDSQMIYSDVYATMALAAHSTSRIRLATGVAVPTTRLAPTVAHSIATINQLAPGRVELGIGSGNTARLTMGLRPITLSRMREEIEVIRTLLRGETAILKTEGVERPVRLLHPRNDFINLEDPIPLTLSAFGPKTLAYCGAEMDAHLTWGVDPEGLAESRKLLAVGAEGAGREPSSVPSKGMFPLAVLGKGETSASPRVLRSLAAFITNYLHVQVEWGDALIDAGDGLGKYVAGYRELAEGLSPYDGHLTLHEGHLVYIREEEKPFIVPELAEAVAMIGEPDALIERIRALEAAGLSHFSFQVTDDPERQIRDFAKYVIERY